VVDDEPGVVTETVRPQPGPVTVARAHQQVGTRAGRDDLKLNPAGPDDALGGSPQAPVRGVQ